MRNGDCALFCIKILGPPSTKFGMIYFRTHVKSIDRIEDEYRETEYFQFIFQEARAQLFLHLLALFHFLNVSIGSPK